MIKLFHKCNYCGTISKGEAGNCRNCGAPTTPFFKNDLSPNSNNNYAMPKMRNSELWAGITASILIGVFFCFK